MTHDPFPREPLTPEEQALARRLAQAGPQAEPSPALDARILAAARAADAGPGMRATRQRPRRWPVALGVAASLVLAIGLAWRLRPLPGPAVEREPAAPMAQAKTPPRSGTEGETMPATVASPPHDTSAFVAPPPPSPAKPLPSRVAPSNLPVVTAPMAPEPPALEAAAPAAPMAAPLPAPPPPAEARSKASQATPDRVETAGSRTRQSDNAAAEQATEDTGIDAAAAADQAAGDEPESEVPPATADSPDVRVAWLQRIRELMAAGQTDAARASLKEFVRRHPDAPVPDDLRALQQ